MRDKLRNYVWRSKIIFARNATLRIFSQQIFYDKLLLEDKKLILIVGSI